MRRSDRYWPPLAWMRAAGIAALAAVTTPAGAQSAQQKAAAEALFDEGYDLRSKGQYEAACRKFEQSEQIDPGVGVLLYLGECYERTGRFASAWATFREASSRAKQTGQAERARIADERARRLDASLSRLTLQVPQANLVPGFELLLNGNIVASALYGISFPVDPGQHEITARAPGRQPWSGTVEVRANADQRSVQIPVLMEAEEPQGGPGAAPAPTGSTYPSAMGIGVGSETSSRSISHSELIPVYLLGGVGVAAIGVGVIFGLRASSLDDDAKQGCPSDCYTRSAADDNEAARTSALVANISYGVGAAAVLTSAYLYFTAGSSAASSARQSGLQLGGDLQRGGGFVSLSGSF